MWIHRPRQGLGGLSPLAAAEASQRGDAVVRAKLAAVVDFREQLGRRPSALRLYHGYPFDRLRRRLGLAPSEPAAVDPADLSCAAPWELAALDPATLDDHRLVDAVASAVGLLDDAIAAPLATELLRRIDPDRRGRTWSARSRRWCAGRWAPAIPTRRSTGSTGPGPWPTPGPRRSSTSGAPRSSRAPTGPTRRCAPICALIRSDAKGAAMALDAAETLIDNRHLDQARPLLDAARDLAQSNGLPWTARRAQELTRRAGLIPREPDRDPLRRARKKLEAWADPRLPPASGPKGKRPAGWHGFRGAAR